MKGVIPIPYIIALIIRVVVISLLGYWFITQGGMTIGSSTQVQCESLCAAWRTSAFNLKPFGIENKCKSQLTGLEIVAPPPATGAPPPSQTTTQGATLGKCMKLLGCSFKSSCSSTETNYGTNSAEERVVCCS